MTLDLQADATIFGMDFGETVIYHPKGGGSRELTEINVFRSPAEAPGGFPDGAPTGSLLVVVPNSSTTGIARSELDLGLDRVAVALKPGGPRTRRKITLVEDEDGGMLRLAVN